MGVLSNLDLARKKPRTWQALKGMLLTLVTIISCLQSTNFESGSHTWAKTFAEGYYPLVLIVLAAVVVFSIDYIYFHNTPSSITYEGYQSLVRAFNNIVYCKLNRFNEAKKQGGYAQCLNVTDPKDQLKEIINQIYYTFRNVSGLDVKVALARRDESGKIKLVCLSPMSHKTSLEAKAVKGQSFIDSIFDNGAFDCIDNLEANYKSKAKKYHYLGKATRGSVIGIPIIEDATGEVLYVLTVKSEDKIFDGKSEVRYGSLLEMFVVRIKLEHSLIEIRRRYVTCSNKVIGSGAKSSILRPKGVKNVG